MEWYQQEIAIRLVRVGQPVDPNAMWKRVKGSNRLSGKALNVLRAPAESLDSSTQDGGDNNTGLVLISGFDVPWAAVHVASGSRI